MRTPEQQLNYINNRLSTIGDDVPPEHEKYIQKVYKMSNNHFEPRDPNKYNNLVRDLSIAAGALSIFIREILSLLGFF